MDCKTKKKIAAYTFVPFIHNKAFIIENILFEDLNVF